VSNNRFVNALNKLEQPTPPIWFMRQAGRYHQHYQKLKEKYTFEELCKTPELASEVACGPINEFDFDVAILFSDILFPLQGLGLGLKFDPGPIFSNYINQNNLKNYSDIDIAIETLQFQKKAIQITKEQLPKSKSLIGFVGGLWTLLRFAIDKKKQISKFEEFYYLFMKDTLAPLIKKNIELQLDAGAEIVMIFDSGLEDLDSFIYKSRYIPLIKEIIEHFPKKIGYYSRGKSYKDLNLMFDPSFAGFGVDSNIDINKFMSSYKDGFIQGNFDQKKMLLDKVQLEIEINMYCDMIMKADSLQGWVCSLGHGVNKQTPEKNVHLFIELIRKRFS